MDPADITPIDLTSSGLVPRLLLGLVAIAAFMLGRPMIEAHNPLKLGEGRLVAELAREAQNRPVAACEGQHCEVTTLTVAAPYQMVSEVRWQAPASVALTWPRRIEYATSIAATELRGWVPFFDDRHGQREPGGWFLRIESNEGGFHAASLRLESSGYVRQLEFVQGDGKRLLRIADFTAERHRGVEAGAAIAGRGRAGPPVNMVYQPVPQELEVELTGPDDMPFAAAQDVVLMLGPDELRVDVPAKVVAADPGSRLVRIRTDDPLWIYRYFQSLPGRDLADDRMRLSMREQTDVAPGGLVSVPASALVAAHANPGSAEGLVWTVVEGMAVPVAVDVVGRRGSDRLVRERATAHAGAVALDAWRHMSLAQRARIHRKQRAAAQAGHALLLHRGAKVVTAPGPSLRAGQALRAG